MFNALLELIGYSGSSYNIDSTIISTCCVCIVVALVVTLDFLYKILLRLFPKDLR